MSDYFEKVCTFAPRNTFMSPFIHYYIGNERSKTLIINKININKKVQLCLLFHN